MNTYRNIDGQYVQADPMGWQEEHPLLVRVIYRILGIGHCGKSGWRS